MNANSENSADENLTAYEPEKFLPEHRAAIEAAVANALAKGKLNADTAASAFVDELEARRCAIAPTEDAFDFASIDERKRLDGEIVRLEAHDKTSKDLLPPYDATLVTRSNVLFKIDEKKRLRDLVDRIVKKRRGGRSISRHMLFREVLRVWVHHGGKITRPSRTATGGPLADYFVKVVGPLLGDDCPKRQSLWDIFRVVEKEITRGGREEV